MLPSEVAKAWIAFKRDYLKFVQRWDEENPEKARLLDEFFESLKMEEKNDDPADWWKK